MDTFERTLRQHAITSNREVRLAPIAELLEGRELTSVGIGTFHRVYRVEGTKWVVKQARHDPAIPLGPVDLPLPAGLLDGMLRWIGMGLLPNANEIRRQYAAYLEIAAYLGYFDAIEEPDTYPDYARLWASQQEIRSRLPDTIANIETTMKVSLPHTLRDLLASPLRTENFLPQEYLIEGIDDHGRATAWIFQEFIAGTPLHDCTTATLRGTASGDRLLLLSFILLLLRHERFHVPDTRPRKPLYEFHDWLGKTDNIIVMNDRVLLVDTRWVWDTRSLFHRGVVVPELLTAACVRMIRSLTDAS